MSTDVEIRTRLSELFSVALTLWGEARSEPIEGIVAVAHVIRNRVLRGSFGWKSIVHRRLQFSCWWREGGAANYERVMVMANRILNGEEIDEPEWQQCLWVTEGVMAGRVRDNTKGSRHYVTTDLLKSAPPLWAKGKKPVEIWGAHSFFNDVA